MRDDLIIRSEMMSHHGSDNDIETTVRERERRDLSRDMPLARV